MSFGSKRFFLIASFLSLFNSGLFAQVVKIGGGWTQTSMQHELGLLSDDITSFTVLAGIDYLERKNLYFSSEIGYYRDGGRTSAHFIETGDTWEFAEFWNYLHINTTFRLKLPLVNEAHLYAEAGPKLDVLVGSEQFTSEIFTEYPEYTKTRFSSGGKTALGVVQDIHRFRVELNFSYLIHTGDAGGTDLTRMKRKNRGFLRLFFGYRLN